MLSASSYTLQNNTTSEKRVMDNINEIESSMGKTIDIIKIKKAIVKQQEKCVYVVEVLVLAVGQKPYFRWF